MSWYMYPIIISGSVVTFALGVYILLLLWRLCYAICCAVSVCRWGMKMCKQSRGHYDKWWTWIPKLFYTQVIEFLFSKPGSVSIHGQSGYWKGIGNWEVYI